MASLANSARAASAVACSSTRQAPRAQQSGGKPALPKQLKHLGAGAAGVLSTTAAGAAQAAFTEPTPFGVAPELPAVSVPSVSLPAVDVPDVSGLLDNPDAVRKLCALQGGCVPLCVHVAHKRCRREMRSPLVCRLPAVPDSRFFRPGRFDPDCPSAAAGGRRCHRGCGRRRAVRCAGRRLLRAQGQGGACRPRARGAGRRRGLPADRHPH